MSSILKALKRVEAESPPALPYQSSSRPIDPKQALNTNAKKRWYLQRLIYLVLILAVIVGSAAVVFTHRELLIAGLSFLYPPIAPPEKDPAEDRTGIYRAKVPTARSVTNQPQRKTASRPAGQINMPTPNGQDKKFQSSATAGNRRSVDRTVGPRQPAAETRSPQTKDQAKVNTQTKRVASPATAASLRKPDARKKPKATQPEARTPQPVRPKPPRKYERINDDKLRLQALAWADDAARRMAVINDQIVHEGESVDGYQILKIREEDVIIQQGGKSWRLEFGLQQ